MFYHLSLLLKNYVSFLNVIHYVSFRAIAALLTSLLFSFVFGNFYIRKSRQFFSSQVREWTPEAHKAKGTMPTMGGIFIIIAVLISSLAWCNFLIPEVIIFLLAFIAYGLIGFFDDWYKIKYKKGMYARTKFWSQLIIAVLTISALLYYDPSYSQISIPFFKNFHIELSYLFIIWATLIIVGTSNAVNLTDGLDGLATSSLIPNFALFSGICYLAGHYVLAHYLHIPFTHSAEITIIGAALVGSCLGFLWYNTYPAQIFMGDVGSLSLGSALALMALLSKQEFLLLISGGLFALETLSVMLQVFWFKRYGTRIFKMAPIHHHFELIGWPEPKITVRFTIITIILCLIALLTLKIR